jgi:hypothetical protein
MLSMNDVWESGAIIYDEQAAHSPSYTPCIEK